MNPPPLILSCDHRGEGLAESLRAAAMSAWRIEDSRNVRETLAQLRALEPDVVVLDPLVEGGRAEIEAFLSARPRETVPPLLVVIDGNRPELATATILSLAPPSFDMVHRGAKPDELRLRIERLLGLDVLRSEIQELRHRALHDDRTDLLRPRAFQQRLSEHFSAAERHKLELALVVIDLDRFGAVNKKFDHTVGDRIISDVGEAIRSTLRAEDIAGRLGGDEFAVLLPYTKRVDAARVTRRLRDRIHSLSGSFPDADEPIEVSASLGFETFAGGDLEGIEALRSHAETALREAKRLGGNRAVYYRSIAR